MASLSPTIACHSRNPTQYNRVYPFLRSSILSLPSHFVFFHSPILHSPTSPIHLHCSFPASPLKPNRSILRSSPGPPPPPGKDSQLSTDFAATFSRLWDKVQIFFAVLFWISLFFWSSAFDGRNSGRKNKRDRFRK
ncbi:uncharacterized protein LOC130812079 [Amaranthus tricolor]|uniref:uncharacterized protein LOC130812079 n=1 Tax=Amaranthus tricolor TaxID=29722 RepID=UPI00258F9604|nr:uncharacterized protein LOC130812079 [Amaranthus tricolor]